MAHLTSIANYWFSAYEISSNIWFSLIYKKTLQIFFLENSPLQAPPLLNHENIDGLLSRVLLVVPEYVDNRGGCRRKNHEKGAANDVAACSILCVAYCPYLYSKYRLCAANVLYAHSSNDCLCRFPLHPLSISAHHAGGGGREHYVLFGGICSVKIHVLVRENRCLHLLLTGLSLAPPVLGNICQGLPALVAW